MIRRLYYNIRIGILHAKFHRALARMTTARQNLDIAMFKQAAESAEDAWRKLVYFKHKIK